MNWSFKLTVIVTLEPCCWVGDCLWNRIGKDRVESFISPLSCTTNAHSGILSMLTRKSVAPNDLMVPLTTSDPEASTRSTSVTVTESPPVTETNNVVFWPEQSKKHLVCFIQTVHEDFFLKKLILLFSKDAFNWSEETIHIHNEHSIHQRLNRNIYCLLKNIYNEWMNGWMNNAFI